MSGLSGGCLCGKVHYTIAGETVFTGVCHCKDCQRANGSAFNTIVAFPSDSVKIEGALTSFTSKGDSGKNRTRRFCPTCGSPIAGESELMPNVTMIEVGSLDHPSAVTPGMHIYCRSKLDWVTIPPGVGTFEAMPNPG